MKKLQQPIESIKDFIAFIHYKLHRQRDTPSKLGIQYKIVHILKKKQKIRVIKKRWKGNQDEKKDLYS